MEVKRKSFFICDILSENFSAFRHPTVAPLGYGGDGTGYSALKAYAEYHSKSGKIATNFATFYLILMLKMSLFRST